MCSIYALYRKCMKLVYLCACQLNHSCNNLTNFVTYLFVQSMSTIQHTLLEEVNNIVFVSRGNGFFVERYYNENMEKSIC